MSRRLGLLLMLLCVTAVTSGGPAVQAVPAYTEGFDTVTLHSGRQYAVPAGAKPAPLRPLLVALPGWRHSPAALDFMSGLRSLHDTEAAMVVYGMGVRLSWNADRCCGDAASRDVDDVTYLADVITDALWRYRTDPSRVYLVGFSNGGMMAYRMACERPDLVAAIGVVAGALTADCDASRPVRAIHVHGEKDRVVPYRGGWSAYCRTRFDPVPEIPARIRAAAPGSVVELRPVAGASHAWPTARAHGYDATSDIFSFLLRYTRLPAPLVARAPRPVLPAQRAAVV